MMPPTKPPRWFTALSKVVGENPKNAGARSRRRRSAHPAEHSAEFQLASVSPDGAPHVRTHIHRAFLAPAAHPSHPLLLTSTDVRTPKVVQLLHEPRVEALFWLQHTQEQFRLAARATLVPAPAHALHGAATAGVPKLLGGRLAPDGIDWEARRRAMFDEMSGHMKASWCRPPPGQKMPGSGEHVPPEDGGAT
jgi:pyridoxamine 5'-phosphate oxidase